MSLKPSDPDYWRAIRPRRGEPWPEQDPKPEVTNLDGHPFELPKPVKQIVKLGEEHGWQVRTGYSRAALRGVRLGTYRVMECVGVWFGPGHESGWRACAFYERFADKTACLIFNFETGEIGADSRTEAAGEPGGWSWDRVTVFADIRRHEISITNLKEFIKVRGSVLPSWFEKIEEDRAKRVAATKEKAKERGRTPVESGG